ncbi:MAG: hypothetical protein ACYDAC_06935 [Candidatus Dormibacteria bacterium]
MQTNALRHRSALVIGLTAGAGLMAGVAAATGTGPFAGLAAQPSSASLASQHEAGPPATPIKATSLFPEPSPSVVHRTVTIYDSPEAAPTPPRATPEASTEPITPAMTSTPSLATGGDDRGSASEGGGDD